jgi:hypothetical protein
MIGYFTTFNEICANERHLTTNRNITNNLNYRVRYQLDRRLDGLQSRSVNSGGEEKNSQHMSGLEPPIIQPVAQRYTTELSHILV